MLCKILKAVTHKSSTGDFFVYVEVGHCLRTLANINPNSNPFSCNQILLASI